MQHNVIMFMETYSGIQKGEVDVHVGIIITFVLVSYCGSHSPSTQFQKQHIIAIHETEATILPLLNPQVFIYFRG